MQPYALNCVLRFGKLNTARGSKMKTCDKLGAAAFISIAGLAAGLAFVGFVYLIKWAEGI
jgi:hypothetical protein